MPEASPGAESSPIASPSSQGNQSDIAIQLMRDMERIRREERLEAERLRLEAEDRAEMRALIATFAPQQQQQQQQHEVGLQGNSPNTSVATTQQVTPNVSLPEVVVQPPPMLLQDVTLQQFKEWKQQWDDYAIMVDLHSLPQPKQLVQLRTSLSVEMRRTLEVSLGVLPSSTLTLAEVINLLHDFVRAQKNEALRRLAFSQCKQVEGEKFTDFYVRLKQAADEVDLCKGHDPACIETQMKHAVLIGVCDEELKRRLLELKSDATLEQVKTVCRSREAAEATTQELRPVQVAVRATSAYKKLKKQKKCPAEAELKGELNDDELETESDEFDCDEDIMEQPASSEKCHKCDEVGHFASQCRSRKAANETNRHKNHGNAWSVVRAPPRHTGQLCAISTVPAVSVREPVAQGHVAPASHHHTPPHTPPHPVHPPGLPTTVWRKGSDHALSRAPVDKPTLEPLISEEAPALPFESVSADVFSTAGKSYLVYVDRLSGWPAVAQYGQDKTTSSTIAFFRMLFRDLGVPVRLSTDGGPQFASKEFRDFLHRWGVRHEMTSPQYLQSNDHPESAVKAVKHLVMKVAPSDKLGEEFQRGLLELRNTPRRDGRSPAQVLYGRPLRSPGPAHSTSFASKWQERVEDRERRAAARAEGVKQQYDSHAKSLPPIRLGAHVRIQDPVNKRCDTIAIVMGRGRSRDYLVRSMAGRVMWKSRRFLTLINPQSSEREEEGRCVT